jgi:hypothetical protein
VTGCTKKEEEEEEEEIRLTQNHVRGTNSM